MSKRRSINLDDIRRQVDDERFKEILDRNPDLLDDYRSQKPANEFFATTTGTISHYVKREIAQRLRSIPILGEVLMGQAENEADNPNAKIARGVRDMTKAEMFGEKARRAWGRFKSK